MTIRNPNKLITRSAVLLLSMALALAPAAPAQEDDAPADDAITPAETTAEDTTPSADSAADSADSADGATPAAPAQQGEAATADSAATPAPTGNPRRAETFGDALAAAGEDGVAIFCYGPDWNKVSTRMLKSFWMTRELEEATGSAILVAVPFYESPNSRQLEESSLASAGMPKLPFGVCPTVMLVDKDGTMYANLPGADYLGTEEDHSKGLKNLREKIAALRKRQELLKKAESLVGVQKAEVLNEIAELPINTPRGLVDQIKEADPTDQSGMVRRNTFSALAFLYEQMHTKDGFLSPDFEPDYGKMTADCMKVIKDKAIRPRDRQAAYLLLIGQARREEINGAKFKNLVNACAKLDPETNYGRLAPVLNNSWANRRITRSREETSAMHKREREKKKERQHKANVDKKADKNGSVR